MRAEIASWRTAPVTAVRFGSFARGEGDEDSDVDLLLVRPSDVAELDDTWDRQQQALRDLVQRATGNACQIMEIDGARLLRHVDLDDPLVQAIHKLLDHSAAQDARLNAICAALAKQGVDCASLGGKSVDAKAIEKLMDAD